MDPASMIVAALVSGILAGVTRSAQDTVYEGYLDLKAAILRRYGAAGGPPLEQAIGALEAEPERPEMQEAVAQQLKLVGADQDPLLQRLAGELTSIIEDPMQRLVSPVEQAHHHAGVRAVAKVMDRHVDTMLGIRERFNLEDTDLLTTNNGGSVKAPREVSDEVERLQQDMREIIEQIAQRIEDNNYRDAEEAIRSMPMAYAERQRATSLVQADKRMHISYQALRITVEYFSELNEGVLEKIDRERSPDREANMMLGNAIMIFELTEFVIRYMNQFRLDGEDDLGRLHRETNERISALREDQRALEARASASNIEAAVRDQTLADIRTRSAAIDELEREWDRYLNEIGTVRSMIGQVHDKIPTLEVIRDNARIQIGAMQLVAMLRFLKRNAEAVKGTIETLKGFRLAPLSPTRVRRLIGGLA
jgi:hypothetical protein